VPTRRASAARTFPAEPACVAAARAWALACCLAAGVEPAVNESVRLLVSEVVTNAITHTESDEFAVRMVIDPEFVEVAVDDTDSRPPRHRHAGPADTGGRGLTLVDVLAEDWGMRALPSGKSVWFRVSRE
jgi:anti-sigma regulatory factor (Ser/Thr protein kinase)